MHGFPAASRTAGDVCLRGTMNRASSMARRRHEINAVHSGEAETDSFQQRQIEEVVKVAKTEELSSLQNKCS